MIISTRMSILISLSILATSLKTLDGHGMVCHPRQRAAYTSYKCGTNLPIPINRVTDHCAHCLNGGAVATVARNLPRSGWHLYDPINNFDQSATRAELCGDPVGQPDHMIGGQFMPLRYKQVPIVEHYKSGSEIDFLAEIDTNHNGYFEFFLCNLDKCGTSDIHGKCFKNGHCHRLLRVPHNDCEDKRQDTSYECGPIDIKYPGRWYLPCRINGLQFVGGKSGKMRYKLPNGVACTHCVIQWYWATSNSCAPRGLLNFMQRKNNPFGATCESDGGGFGTYRRGMAQCGSDNQIPEEFWSCSDVQITSDGRPSGAVKAIALKETTEKLRSDTYEQPIVGKEKDKMMNEAEAELKRENSQPVWRKRQEEQKNKQRSKNGECLQVGKRCDGGVPCCGIEVVCVHMTRLSGFSCAYWWSLYKEVEYRDAKL